jgi:hypothetical protein
MTVNEDTQQSVIEQHWQISKLSNYDRNITILKRKKDQR